MNKQVSTLLKTTQAAFFLNALVWLVFAVMSFSLAFNGAGNWRFVLSTLMVINASIFVGFGFLIRKGQSRVFFLGILYVAVNVVLSITDQFGWFDFGILLLNLIVLGLLFITKHRLEQAKV
jgi:hypothetical protein